MPPFNSLQINKMEITTENTLICAENEKKLKRGYEDSSLELECVSKKSKQQSIEATNNNQNDTPKETSEATTNETTSLLLPVYRSPKKRLQLTKNNDKKNKNKEKFIYGNYSQYYGYRNKDKDCSDIRLDIFATNHQLFTANNALDIGCNSGFITMEIAKRFAVKNIIGLDIDNGLIKQATKQIIKYKKGLPFNNKARKTHTFPFNITFQHGNYVLRDDVLLEIEREQFDLILCLSVTKWIHLNFGDSGLKQAFKRMFLQLRKGGKLILEAQPFDNYGRRKKMTENIFANFKAMQFFPNDFTAYLLSSEVGFTNVETMGVPENCVAGFKRPIQIFFKD